MKRISFIIIPLLFAAQSAIAADRSADNTSALSLAALVGLNSPQVNAAEKALLNKYLESETKAPFAAGKTIVVKADAVTCRNSDVDIAAHSCELTFGAKKLSLQGRKAHELYTTLIENGVPGDAGAGSLFESVANLDCAIKPDEVKQEDGSGAHCKFTTTQ